MSGCSAVWLAHFLGVEEVACSSQVTPTIYLKIIRNHPTVLKSIYYFAILMHIANQRKTGK